MHCQQARFAFLNGDHRKYATRLQKARSAEEANGKDGDDAG